MPCSLAGGAGEFVNNPHNPLNPPTVVSFISSISSKCTRVNSQKLNAEANSYYSRNS